MTDAVLDQIRQAVREQAEEALVLGPEPPAELGAARIVTDRYVLFLAGIPSLNTVARLRMRRDEPPAVLAEVRDFLRSRDRSQACWQVGPLGRAEGLDDALREAGLTPYTEPPLEPTGSCMALVRPPDSGDPNPRITVEVADTLERLRIATEIACDAFGMSTQDREAMLDKTDERFRLQQEGKEQVRVHLAYLDGEPVGISQAVPLDAGVNLSGAGVVASARGQGVYRELVRVRWQEAVERGTPALTVQAGSHSRPILERLGFVTVAVIDMLLDRF